MKTKDILNLDYRKEENKKIIQKVLRKIKPLSKFSDENDIPLQAIERVIKILTNKYEIIPKQMMMSYYETDLGIYSIEIRKNINSYEHIGTVYGMCVYEVFAKLAIKMYSEVKLGNIPERVLTKEEKQRERIAKKIDKTKGEY